MILKLVRAEVMVRVRVRLEIGLDLGFGLRLVWNSTVYCVFNMTYNNDVVIT